MVVFKINEQTNMKKLFILALGVDSSGKLFNWGMFCFRVLVSIELIVVHGLKKIGVGVQEAEHIPNPLHLPETFNNSFAIAANLFFPLMVIAGFCTRLATLPTLAVTLTGYFVVHGHDTLLERDIPFMYSLAFLLIAVLGAGKYSIDNYLYKKLRQ
jgi:putative oxidoreductase